MNRQMFAFRFLQKIGSKIYNKSRADKGKKSKNAVPYSCRENNDKMTEWKGKGADVVKNDYFNICCSFVCAGKQTFRNRKSGTYYIGSINYIYYF